MARKLRLEYPGAVYHVISRGDRREAIYLSDRDRGLFLDTLAETCARTGFRVHSFVLMNNHYHMLLETPEGNLVVGMKWLQGTYTIRFNRRHRLSGHLFQGRYKAIPVNADDPEYFRMVSDYIHLNPARIKMLDKQNPRLESYRWSSYGMFVSPGSLPPWLDRYRIFASHDLRGEASVDRRRYGAYMKQKVHEILDRKISKEQENEWNQIRRGWYIGDDQFRVKLEEMVDKAVKGKKRSSFSRDGLERHDEKVAADLLKRGLEALNLSAESVRNLRPSDPRKQVLVWLLRSRTLATGTWLNNRMVMGHPGNISRAVAAFRNPMDKALIQMKKRIMQLCKD